MRRKLITTILSCRHLRCRTSAWDLASAPWRPPDFFSGDQWMSDKKYLKILGSQSHPCHVLFWWKTPLETHLMYNPGYFTQSKVYVVWFYDTFINMEGIRWILCNYVCIYIWVNYSISLTKIKAILGWFPLLTRYMYWSTCFFSDSMSIALLLDANPTWPAANASGERVTLDRRAHRLKP